MSILGNRLAASVEAVIRTSNGTMVGTPAVLRGLHLHDASGGQAGSVILKDGGSGGPEKLHINTPGGGVAEDVVIPAGGIEFGTDIYVELVNVDDVTIFFHR